MVMRIALQENINEALSPLLEGMSSNEEISSCSGFERMVQIDWYLKARRSTQKEENSLKQNEFM